MRLYRLLVVLCLLFFVGGSAVAQESISIIHISEINSTDFPDVRVQIIIRDSYGALISSQDLPRYVDLYEDGQEMTFTHREVYPGVETMFVLDAGAGVTFDEGGASGKSRLGEMRDILRDHAAGMQEGDSTGIILHRPGDVRVYQSITSDSGDVHTAVGDLTLDKTSDLTKGLEGIMYALDVLEDAPGRGVLVQSVFFISSGIQTTQGSVVDYRDVVERSRALGIPVHVVFVRQSEDDLSKTLKSLAEDTDGIYAYYEGLPSIRDITAWLTMQKTQYELLFHSISNESSDRTIEVVSTGGESDNAIYQVDILPPSIVIQEPVNGEEITRSALDADADLDSVEPTTLHISAEVLWPDGYPRNINQVQLWVDGEPISSPILNPGKGELVTFSLDLRPYRTIGENNIRLQIRAQDELGFEGRSDEVRVTVRVFIPRAEVEEETCSDLQGSARFFCNAKEVLMVGSTFAGWFSLGLAAIAIVLAIWFRRPITHAAGKVADVARDTFVALTRSDIAKATAYLSLEQGGSVPLGRRYDLFPGTTVKMGRDRNQVSIVFDADKELSVVSRLHCEISIKNGKYFVRDLGSTHGTFVNNVRIPRGSKYALTPGDTLELGPADSGGVLLRFNVIGVAAVSPTERPLDRPKDRPAVKSDDAPAHGIPESQPSVDPKAETPLAGVPKVEEPKPQVRPQDITPRAKLPHLDDDRREDDLEKKSAETDDKDEHKIDGVEGSRQEDSARASGDPLQEATVRSRSAYMQKLDEDDLLSDEQVKQEVVDEEKETDAVLSDEVDYSGDDYTFEMDLTDEDMEEDPSSNSKKTVEEEGEHTVEEKSAEIDVGEVEDHVIEDDYTRGMGIGEDDEFSEEEDGGPVLRALLDGDTQSREEDDGEDSSTKFYDDDGTIEM
jgi:predicted component of type VI protein secretion system